MARDIQPLTQADLPELSRFLAAGFQAPPEADFVAPEVLRWKYLEPAGWAIGEKEPDTTGRLEHITSDRETGTAVSSRRRCSRAHFISAFACWIF